MMAGTVRSGPCGALREKRGKGEYKRNYLSYISPCKKLTKKEIRSEREIILNSYILFLLLYPLSAPQGQ